MISAIKPPKAGILLTLTTYGPPNNSGDIWVNRIHSTNYVGTWGLQKEGVIVNGLSFSWCTISQLHINLE